MPSPDALAAALEKQRIRRAVEQRQGLTQPAVRHRCDEWTYRCAACGETWPCRASLTDPSRPLTHEEDRVHDVGTIGLLTALGLALFAAAVLILTLVILG